MSGSPAVGRRCIALSAAVLLAIPAALAADGEARLEEIATPPPELAAPLRALLAQPGWRVARDEKPLAELWVRRELPTGGANEGALGVELGFLPASALVGVVRLHDTWIDYRDTDVQPGLYTLRYWVQPADGDHMGVSQYRDFLLLSRVSDDLDPEAVFEEQALLEMAQKASERVHPAVMALFPVFEEVSGGAQLVRNELDQLTLAVSIGDRTLGFVLEGHGELP